MEPVLQIKGNRFAYFLLALFAACFSGLFTLVVFAPDLVFDFFNGSVSQQTIPVIGNVIFLTLAIAGMFLFYNWMKMFIRNPALFCIYTDGFSTNTNGISSGFIGWYNIERIEEVTLSSNTRNGAHSEAHLAFYLKDYEGYKAEMPALFRSLYRIAEKSGRFTYTDRKKVTHEEVPLFIPISVFGSRYAEVKQLLYKGAGQAAEL